MTSKGNFTPSNPRQASVSGGGDHAVWGSNKQGTGMVRGKGNVGIAMNGRNNRNQQTRGWVTRRINNASRRNGFPTL